MARNRKLTSNLASEARAMIARGDSAASVARQFGVTITTIRRWTDPDYLAHRKARINACRRARKSQP